MYRNLIIAFLILLSPAINSKVIETSLMKVNREKLFEIDDSPWGMTFIDSNTLVITSKEGFLLSYDLKTKKQISKIEVPGVRDVGQGGLLDVQKHPLFVKNQTLLFTYSKSTGGTYATTLAKVKYLNNKFSNFEDILVTKSSESTNRHFGSRITFDEKNKKMFISIGDRGKRDKAQDLNFHHGKILRLNYDGSFPKDNPFKKHPAIWSYGHRNPQGLFFDKETNLLIEQEHGPRGGDEINIIEKAANYGWPIITYGKEYWGPSIGEGTKKAGLKQPIKFYVPSIAPCGLLLYRGTKLKQWNGHLFSGALKLRHINRIALKVKKKKLIPVSEERISNKWNKRIRNIIQGPDELIYFATDNGGIYRISPQQ